MNIKKLIITAFLFIIGFQVVAQDQIMKLDTILLLSRKKLVVQVKNVSSATVRYFDPKNQGSFTIERKQIQQIVFSNGRKEIFNKPAFSMVAEGDWKTIIVTDNKSDVSGLYELGPVIGRSSAGSQDAKSAKRSAIIRLQKKAALLGAAMVLVTKEEPIGGYGEPPSFNVEGIAYGYEPPKEKTEEENPQ